MIMAMTLGQALETRYEALHSVANTDTLGIWWLFFKSQYLFLSTSVCSRPWGFLIVGFEPARLAAVLLVSR
jgi:hypothetical protein